MNVPLPYWKLAALLLAVTATAMVVAGYAKKSFGPAITPPREYAEANLRVDIVVLRGGKPVPSYSIHDGMIVCEIPFPESETHKWCQVFGWDETANQEVLNTPVKTDSEGRATLWFKVNPAPDSEYISLVRPRLHLNKRESWPDSGQQLTRFFQEGYKPTILEPHHWVVEAKIGS